MQIAIIGAGPAGLRAAEIAASGGAAVTVYDAKPSAGRKFLVAGRGGLNLTHATPAKLFSQRYSGPDQPPGFWDVLIAEFDADKSRAWADGLGVKTFAASTGRVYPEEMKAAPLLRRWIDRLRSLGVNFAMRHRWTGLEREGTAFTLRFEAVEGPVSRQADAVILALGGGSWPDTGSNGQWVTTLAAIGVSIAPLESANCGWETSWPAEFLAIAEGQPLKNIVASVGPEKAAGELLVTAYGLEGGALYQLTPQLRAMAAPVITIDLKPTVSVESLVQRLGTARRNLLGEAGHRWRLGPAAQALLRLGAPAEAAASATALAAAVKSLQIPLIRPRPLAEAISSAGGVRWSEVDPGLMLRKLPGVFVAGEMIDWEAPTGGFLLHGCLVTGALAGRGALEWVQAKKT